MDNNLDKAGESYWSSFWKSAEQLPPAAITDGKLSGSYVVHELDRLFSMHLPEKKSAQGLTLLEVGCGNSIWLSYFHQRFGYQVYGIDYSEYGCEQTRKILQRDGCPGTIYHGDMFQPPSELKEKFDVVCSFGVVEHFQDTESALKACSYFLKPGGILITTVPNLLGPTGFLQRILYKPVYDIHVVMDKSRLVKALESCGLSVSASTYFCSLSFGVTLEPVHDVPVRAWKAKKFLLKFFQAAGKLINLIDNRMVRLPKGRWTSEGIFTLAVKPVS